jgi:soluble lytic murein transglycosylase-like protein
MKTRVVIAITLALAALSAEAREGMFVASDVPSARIRKSGKIVVRNDAQRITAFRFYGDIKEALVSLRSVRRIAASPFGSSVFNSSATLNAPVPTYLSGVIHDAAREHGVDPRLIAAVVRRESAWNPRAVSPVGAQGLMQLMPATAKFLGVTNVFDERQNIFGGTRYLRTLLDTFDGDLNLTLAAYNAGPGAVRKYNGIPPYRETRAYVAAIRASYEKSLVVSP